MPVIAVAAIRRGDVARHREWMMRFFAVGGGIVVIRLVLPVMIWLTRPAAFREVIGSAFWAGWLVSLLAAEVWIRATRPRQIAPFAATEV